MKISENTNSVYFLPIFAAHQNQSANSIATDSHTHRGVLRRTLSTPQTRKEEETPPLTTYRRTPQRPKERARLENGDDIARDVIDAGLVRFACFVEEAKVGLEEF
jgi:hypothetical protein